MSATAHVPQVPHDPALARLHEVTERIRRRAAEARARAVERGRRSLSASPRELQLTLQLPLPRRSAVGGGAPGRAGCPAPVLGRTG